MKKNSVQAEAQSAWIVAPFLDVVFLSCAGIVVFGVLTLLESRSLAFFAALTGIAVFDMTHIYITGLRIYCEYHMRPRWFMAVFVGLFAFITTAHYVGVPFLLSFVLYYAMMHFMRQNYGIYRWYLRRNGHRTDRILDWLLFGITVLPFIAMHLRSDFSGAGFVSDHNELFLMPWQEGFITMLWMIGVTIVLWIVYEAWLWRNGVREWGRLIFFASNALLYNVAFLFSNNGLTIVFSLITIHAAQYLLLMGHFSRQRYAYSLKGVLYAIGASFCVAVVDIGARIVFDVDFARIMASHSIWSSVAIGALLLPSLAHYTIDIWIWRRWWIAKI